MNRITASIERRQKLMADLLESGKTTAEAQVKAGKAMDLTFEDWFLFNELKSLAQAMTKNSYEEAQTIYEYLGESGPERFNAAPIHVKVALTHILAELTSWKLRGAPAPTQRVA